MFIFFLLFVIIQLYQDIKTEGNLGVAQRSPMDPSSIYGQSIIQAKSGLGGPGK